MTAPRVSTVTTPSMTMTDPEVRAVEPVLLAYARRAIGASAEGRRPGPGDAPRRPRQPGDVRPALAEQPSRTRAAALWSHCGAPSSMWQLSQENPSVLVAGSNLATFSRLALVLALAISGNETRAELSLWSASASDLALASPRWGRT
jgi:hypothetical protein